MLLPVISLCLVHVVIQGAVGSVVNLSSSHSNFNPLLTKTLTLTCGLDFAILDPGIQPKKDLVGHHHEVGHTVSPTMSAGRGPTAPPSEDTPPPSKPAGSPNKGPMDKLSRNFPEDLATKPVTIRQVTSIVILNLDSGETIAAINMDQQPVNTQKLDNVIVKGSVGNSVTGKKPYLEIDWDYPHQGVAGRYQCRIDGYDENYLTTVVTAEVELTSSKPDLDDMIGNLNALHIQVDRLEDRLNALGKPQGSQPNPGTMFGNNIIKALTIDNRYMKMKINSLERLFKLKMHKTLPKGQPKSFRSNKRYLAHHRSARRYYRKP